MNILTSDVGYVSISLAHNCVRNNFGYWDTRDQKKIHEGIQKKNQEKIPKISRRNPKSKTIWLRTSVGNACKSPTLQIMHYCVWEYLSISFLSLSYHFHFGFEGRYISIKMFGELSNTIVSEKSGVVYQSWKAKPFSSKISKITKNTFSFRHT